MNFDEKKADLEKQSGGVAPAISPEDELAIISPDPIMFSIGEGKEKREYEVKPLTLGKQRLLSKLVDIDPTIKEDDMYDLVVDVVSKLINEPDKEFIMYNFYPHDIALLKIKLAEAQNKQLLIVTKALAGKKKAVSPSQSEG